MFDVDTKFELCSNVEYVLKIGRDYQNKDGFRGAHYDTVKLLCDTIEYLRDKLPKPDPDWKAICKKCHDGEIEPKERKHERGRLAFCGRLFMYNETDEE